MFAVLCIRVLSSEKSGLVILCAISLLLTNPVNASWYHDQWDIMGTRVSVDLWHLKENKARECAQKIEKEMRRIDSTLSTYKNDSEVSRVNKNASIETVQLGTELTTLIAKSLDISEISNGAFDISYALSLIHI